MLICQLSVSLHLFLFMKPLALQISQSNRGPSTHHMQAVTMAFILISRPSSLFKGANSHSHSEFAFKPLLFHPLLQPRKNKLLLLIEGFPFWLMSILSSTLFQSFEKTLRYCIWTGKIKRTHTCNLYTNIHTELRKAQLTFCPKTGTLLHWFLLQPRTHWDISE